MLILTAFFILKWYQASNAWWVAFWVVLAWKFGNWFIKNFGDDVARIFELENEKYVNEFEKEGR